jgi:hypothetical protein
VLIELKVRYELGSALSTAMAELSETGELAKIFRTTTWLEPGGCAHNNA